VWGEDDAIIPVAHAYAAHQAIRSSRLEIIENAGHFPHVEAPTRFVAAVVDFIQTTQPADLGTEDLRQLLRDGASGIEEDRGSQ
jgi:alpha-beta hydrolase superfamily lysophospholipase